MMRLNGFQVNNKIILFLNGEIPNSIPDLSKYYKVFCTDGAFLYLNRLGIMPDVISGDFDSLMLQNFPPEVEIILTPDQNYPDFEKALQIIVEKGFRIVDVFGASGKQQDHFLGNLSSAYNFKDQLKITFIDNYSTYFFLENENKISKVLNKTISLYPFPVATGIKTDGLLYPLNNETLTITERIGTRNKATEQTINISFKDGSLILFIMND